MQLFFKRYIILIPLLFISALKGVCQNGDKDFDRLYNSAIAVYERESIDSSITLFHQVISMAEAKHYNVQNRVSYCYSALGRCYSLKKKYPEAHKYMTEGLMNARAYHDDASIIYAVTSLSQLHYLIQFENADFPYQPPATTVTEIVSFPIEKIEAISSDSCRITIAGGRLDGIKDSTFAGDVFTRYDAITKREAGTFLGTAKITRSDDNKTYATIKFNGKIPVVKDLVKIRAEVPAALSRSIFKDFILQSIFWKSNNHERLFDRRFIYYFYDPLMEKEAFRLFNSEVKEVVSKLITIDDTTGKGAYAAKIEDGLFKGNNVIKGMLLADSAVYKLFLDYVLQNPANYEGNDLSFRKCLPHGH